MHQGEQGSINFTVEESRSASGMASAGCHLVKDVRFFAQPQFVPALRPYSGQEPAVRQFVLEQPDTTA